jgi:hypothetical protein
LLPGWTNSFGAKIERLAADKLGLEIYHLADLIPEEA